MKLCERELLDDNNERSYTTSRQEKIIPPSDRHRQDFKGIFFNDVRWKSQLSTIFAVVNPSISLTKFKINPKRQTQIH